MKIKIILENTSKLYTICIHFFLKGVSEETNCKLPCSYPSKLKFLVTIGSLSTYYTELFANVNLCSLFICRGTNSDEFQH